MKTKKSVSKKAQVKDTARSKPLGDADLAGVVGGGNKAPTKEVPSIEISDYGFGVSMPVTSSRSDGGGSTVGK